MARIDDGTTIWMATVRPDGRPHLTPIWYVWHDGKVWVCTGMSFVKTRNVLLEPRVALSLEDGADPVVAEGTVVVHGRPYPRAVARAFRSRFDWDIDRPDADGEYDALWEITIDRWLMGSPET
jgi:F420H(2)-dependent biliverdin reductase